jgi:hypothetical protein
MKIYVFSSIEVEQLNCSYSKANIVCICICMYIGAPMQPMPRGNADRTHCVFKLYFTDFFNESVLLAQDASVRQ